MNKNDSLIISDLLQARGFQPVDDPESADIYIINTCSVREHAENRALSHISALKAWHNRDRILVIAGCMSVRLGNELLKKFPHIDLVIGPDSYRKLIPYLDAVLQNETKIIDVSQNQETYCGIHPRTDGVTAYVSIMRGCNNFCSYCIVPYVRGRARSRPLPDIIEEVKMLVDNGIKEITLLGQNVNEYKYQGIDFSQLLEKIGQETRIPRLRFLTSHPKDFDFRIIDTIKKNKNICPWFHLPLQSGSNRILQLMNRCYTKEHYLNLVDRIREELPDATLSTDIIVGFPTETDGEYEETIELIKKIRFDDAYMYRYSPRPGTRAAKYKNIPEPIIRERLQNLIQLQNRIILEKTRQMLDKTYEVLIEGPARNGSRGKTRGNKDVVVKETLTPGQFYTVRITEISGRTPLGRRI